MILIVGVEVWAVVLRSGLGKHSDDDPEESSKFWQEVSPGLSESAEIVSILDIVK